MIILELMVPLPPLPPLAVTSHMAIPTVQIQRSSCSIGTRGMLEMKVMLIHGKSYVWSMMNMICHPLFVPLKHHLLPYIAANEPSASSSSFVIIYSTATATLLCENLLNPRKSKSTNYHIILIILLIQFVIALQHRLIMYLWPPIYLVLILFLIPF